MILMLRSGARSFFFNLTFNYDLYSSYTSEESIENHEEMKTSCLMSNLSGI